MSVDNETSEKIKSGKIQIRDICYKEEEMRWNSGLALHFKQLIREALIEHEKEKE